MLSFMTVIAIVGTIIVTNTMSVLLIIKAQEEDTHVVQPEHGTGQGCTSARLVWEHRGGTAGSSEEKITCQV